MTDRQKQLTKSAREAFQQADYSTAFNILLNESPDFLISYAEKTEGKTNWFSKTEKSSHYFWNEYILQDEIFEVLLRSNSVDQLFHNYFYRNDDYVDRFELRVVEKFPYIYIRSIRLNQVYLKENRIDFLCGLNFEASHKIHQKVWHFIFKQDKLCWVEIQSELDKLRSLSTQQILINCIVWIEEFRFKKNSKEIFTRLGSTYSLFMELIFDKYHQKANEPIKEDEFIIEFVKTIGKLKSNHSEPNFQIVSNLLKLLLNWVDFRDIIIYPYSYDLNINPVQQNEQIFFKSNPLAFYQWKVDGIRYEVNQQRYYFRAAEILNNLEEQQYIKIAGKTTNDIQLNREKEIFRFSTLELMRDLGIEHFKVGENEVLIDKILNPLLNYSYNRNSRYESGILPYIELSFNWLDAYLKFTYVSILSNSSREPFAYISVQDYSALNKKNILDDCTDDIIKLFGYRPKSKKEFNRFNLQYDVWLKPFFCIGDFLFTPLAFFANNVWFYSFAQNVLNESSFYWNKTKTKTETKRTECLLGKQFERIGWLVEVITDEKANQIEGDVDIFIKDNDDVLLIQMKRTKFRLDLKDSYYESIKSDIKATEQLNLAEKNLLNDKTIFDIGTKKPVKWIVSTSFENIGKEFDGCRKINYFELLNVLNNPDIKSLEELINYLESDKSIKEYLSNAYNKELYEEERALFKPLKESLSIYESKQYYYSICSEDEKVTSSKNELYKNAIDEYYNENYNKALILIHKYIDSNPEDIDGYAALGNTLANKGLYESALWAFKKSLELLPNDPYNGRNYAIALMESSRFFEGLNYALDLFEKYPLLGDFDSLFRVNFEQFKSSRLLNNNQISELEHRWNKLN